MYELSSEVEELVNQLETVGRRTEVFLNNTVNPVGYKSLIEDVEEVSGDLSQVEPETEYEELVLDEIECRIESIEGYASFITGESDLEVPEAIDKVHGEGTYERLKKDTLNRDFESEYEASWVGFNRETVDPRRDDVGFDLDSELDFIKDIVDEYARDRGIFGQNFSYDVISIPASRKQRASWHGSQNEAKISKDYFQILREEEGLVLDASNVIRTYFHEILGHGVHQTNSEVLHFPKFNSRPMRSPSTQSHIEGIAQMRDREAIEFMEEYSDILPVTEEGILLAEHNVNSSKMARQVMPRLLKERERRGEIDSAKEVLEEAYPEMIAESSIANAEMPLTAAFKEASYSGGRELMERVDYDAKDTVDITTGTWSPEILPRAIEFFEKD